mmetsp:Transcript_8233/g.13052  ORF Transcript_8233/g.13052 Transcript_8233/m.13052 type:complete len:82 (+) Transcript_8233:386-631(+)
MSYLVPTRIATAVLLKPRACRYHSLTLLSVATLDRSNMNSNAAWVQGSSFRLEIRGVGWIALWFEVQLFELVEANGLSVLP